MRRVFSIRAVRHVALTTALVLLVCAVVWVGCLLALRAATAPGLAVDQAATGMGATMIIALGVLGYDGWLLATRGAARRRPARDVPMRRVRIQRGLMTRSWLETEATPELWIPVYFDPVLVTMASPTSVLVRGALRRGRLVAVEIGGVPVHPSGRVTARRPLGPRVDNPSAPDAGAAEHAAAAARWTGQLRADAARVVVAPAVGAFWVLLAGGGFTAWLAVTAIASALALWSAAVRGSDPS